METKCPICNSIIRENYNYCSSCGLPKRITSKRQWQFKVPDSNSNILEYVRPEHNLNKTFDYQKCSACDTPNPFGAKYCRRCGVDSKLQAKDKYGHGWVDLGLSVLWSTETIEGLYLWNHSVLELSSHSDMRHIRIDIENKDIATTKWGLKWRTPTKQEFEELIKKCTWEKVIIPISNTHAFKVIGPNGNSITLNVTGSAGSDPDYISSSCHFWTSTEALDGPYKAYAFHLRGYPAFSRTPTARELTERMFELNREPLWRSPLYDDKSIHERAKQREEERKILQAMGNDSNERMDNLKKDLERSHSLWLETPIEFIFDNPRRNTINLQYKTLRGYAIRPVADKKWQGKL